MLLPSAESLGRGLGEETARRSGHVLHALQLELAGQNEVRWVGDAREQLDEDLRCLCEDEVWLALLEGALRRREEAACLVLSPEEAANAVGYGGDGGGFTSPLTNIRLAAARGAFALVFGPEVGELECVARTRAR